MRQFATTFVATLITATQAFADTNPYNTCPEGTALDVEATIQNTWRYVDVPKFPALDDILNGQNNAEGAYQFTPETDKDEKEHARPAVDWQVCVDSELVKQWYTTGKALSLTCNEKGEIRAFTTGATGRVLDPYNLTDRQANQPRGHDRHCVF